MVAIFENEMMKQCCDESGKLDFESMKTFMTNCGKGQFSDGEIEMIRRCCSRQENPDIGQIKQLMNACGCRCG